jgi:hypothetical protein
MNLSLKELRDLIDPWTISSNVTEVNETGITRWWGDIVLPREILKKFPSNFRYSRYRVDWHPYRQRYGFRVYGVFKVDDGIGISTVYASEASFLSYIGEEFLGYIAAKRKNKIKYIRGEFKLIKV